MSDFEVLVISWLAGLTGTAIVCDILPRIYRYYRNRVTPESRIRALRPLSNSRKAGK